MFLFLSKLLNSNQLKEYLYNLDNPYKKQSIYDILNLVVKREIKNREFSKIVKNREQLFPIFP